MDLPDAMWWDLCFGDWNPAAAAAGVNVVAPLALDTGSPSPSPTGLRSSRSAAALPLGDYCRQWRAMMRALAEPCPYGCAL